MLIKIFLIKNVLFQLVSRTKCLIVILINLKLRIKATKKHNKIIESLTTVKVKM